MSDPIPISLEAQLELAKQTLRQMVNMRSRWAVVQEAIVRTLEWQLALRQIGDEMMGKEKQ